MQENPRGPRQTLFDSPVTPLQKRLQMHLGEGQPTQQETGIEEESPRGPRQTFLDSPVTPLQKRLQTHLGKGQPTQQETEIEDGRLDEVSDDSKTTRRRRARMRSSGALLNSELAARKTAAFDIPRTNSFNAAPFKDLKQSKKQP